MNEDLKWLAENVHEVPEDLTHMKRLWTLDTGVQFAFFPKGRNPREWTPVTEWQAARDELSGKPGWDEAPEGARIRVQNDDGKWIFGTYNDARAGNRGEWHGIGPGDWLFSSSRDGTVLGDWRKTLERRPENTQVHITNHGTISAAAHRGEGGSASIDFGQLGKISGPGRPRRNDAEIDVMTESEERDYPVETGQTSNMLHTAHEHSAPAIVSAALRHMQDRATTYDSPNGERSMGKTVAAFNALTGRDLTEQEGWLLMAVLKMARSTQGDFRADNFEDLAAYAGLYGEAAAIRARELGE